MKRTVESNKVDKTLRELLKDRGYQLNKPRKNGEWGADIIALKNETILYFEVIGHKADPKARTADFYTVFFRALARLNDGAKKCIIAVPVLSKKSIMNRVNYIRTAWKKISEAFPELEIWLVDVENKKYKKTSWIEWIE